MDKHNVNVSFSRNWEHLESKYVGTGHPDTTKFEWALNHQRDTLASHLGHSDLVAFLGIAENESLARVKLNLVERMLQPCGPPPEREDDA